MIQFELFERWIREESPEVLNISGDIINKIFMKKNN